MLFVTRVSGANVLELLISSGVFGTRPVAGSLRDGYLSGPQAGVAAPREVLRIPEGGGGRDSASPKGGPKSPKRSFSSAT